MELTAAAIEAAFGETGDFVAREVEAAGWRLRLYFIDGLVTGGTISEYVLRPLAQALTGATMGQLVERAERGAVYNAVCVRVTDGADALSKLLNGFALVL